MRQLSTSAKVIHVALVLMAGLPSFATAPAWMSNSGILRDAQGNAYVVGSVTQDIVPVTPGAFQTKFNGGTCGITYAIPHGPGSPIPCSHGFAAKISADGSKLLYATYIQGSQNDFAHPVGVDSSGTLFLRIDTSSTDFPATASISGLPPSGNAGTFILALSPDGQRLLFCDGFGFPGYQGPTTARTELMPDGNLVFFGTTDGTAFHTTPGAYLSARPNASLDGFVLEWDPQTNTIVRSTLIGGSDQDLLTGLAMDAAGNVYVTGYTISKDFPVTPGAFYSPGTPEARVNVFVAKLDADLSTLDFALLFGGSYHPIPNAIALDSSGNVYIDGWGSPDLPVNPGAFETSFEPSLADGFLAKFDGNNGARIYLTYLADGHAGIPGALAAASDGSVWVAGKSAYGGVLNTPDALEPSLSNIYLTPPYLKHISADGSPQLYGTYLAEFLALAAPGVALVSDSVNFFQIHDFNIPSPAPKPPLITSVVNAASMSQPGYIAPGEILFIFGVSIGPDQPVGFEFDSAGRVSSNLVGFQVLIDGTAAPILFASKNQINVVSPFSLSMEASGSIFAIDAAVQVHNPGSSTPLMLTTTKVASLPGIFASESGAGLILNEDATTNGRDNPATQGSTISLFVTGLGPLTPAPVDGTIAPAATSKPALPIQVFLGHEPTDPYTQLDSANVQYAGDAPDQVEGVQQINVQLPAGALFSRLYIKAGSGVSNAVVFSEQ